MPHWWVIWGILTKRKCESIMAADPVTPNKLSTKLKQLLYCDKENLVDPGDEVLNGKFTIFVQPYRHHSFHASLSIATKHQETNKASSSIIIRVITCVIHQYANVLLNRFIILVVQNLVWESPCSYCETSMTHYYASPIYHGAGVQPSIQYWFEVTLKKGIYQALMPIFQTTVNKYYVGHKCYAAQDYVLTDQLYGKLFT